MTPATKQQVDALLQYLHANPAGVSTYQITKHMGAEFGYAARGAPYLVWLARNVYGDDVVVTEYEYKRSVYVFRLPKDLAEVDTYSRVRTALVYRHMANIVRMIDRGIVGFPGEDSTAITEVRIRLIAAMSLVQPVAAETTTV